MNFARPRGGLVAAKFQSAPEFLDDGATCRADFTKFPSLIPAAANLSDISIQKFT